MMRWSEEASSSASAPTIKNHSVTHFNGYLYCFGGYDGRRNHNALLLYSLAEHKWIRPHPVGAPHDTNAPPSSFALHGTPPPGRNGHSATLALDDDDPDHARIFIIGGWLGTGPLAASDCHILQVHAGTRRLQWYQPAVRGTPPGACNMHSADFCKQQRSVYVFRGGNGREYLNDLHALHVDTLTWRRVETTGQVPQQRANHSSAMLEETGELIIFGGWNGSERLNDIHVLDTETSNWTCPRVGGVLPHPRAGMTLTALRGRLFLFGGSGTSAKCFQDLQILDRQEMAWLDVTQDADTDAGRHRGVVGGAASDSIGHYGLDESIFRFGGSNAYEDRTNPLHPGEAPDVVEGRQGGYGHDVVERSVARLPSLPEPAGQSFMSSRRTDWRSRELAAASPRHASFHSSPNPNDEDTVPSVLIQGHGPGRRYVETNDAFPGASAVD